MSGAGLHRRPVHIAAALFALVIAGACGGGSDNGGTTNPGNQNPAISISLSSATAAVQQGATTSVTVTLTRSGGFTGDVALAVDGLPTGVTVNSATIAAGQTTATLTLTAAAAATVGTASLTVRATGSGVTTATAPLALTVNATTPAGSFSLTANPTTVSLAQGASATVTITIARTGAFTGPVALTVSGAPTGLTTTLSSASVTGTSATLTLAAASSLATGAQTLTIKGTGTGAADQTLTLPVTITAATSSSGNVAWKFCGTSGLPIWVAAQDGTGAWTRVTGTNNTYSFTVGARGGIAYVVQTSTGFDLEVFYGTGDELTSRGTQLCNGAVGAGKTITAPIVGASGTDIVLASLGPSAASVNLATSTTATFQNVPDGTLDLIASRSALAISGTSATITLNKMLIRRGLNPPAGSALAAIDFGSSEAFDPVTRNLTIGNIGTDVAIISGLYFTANNTFGAYLTDISAVTGGARTYKGVPAANQASGDLHILSVSAVPSLTQTTQTRNVTTAFKDAIDRTITLGPALNAPTVSALPATGYGRVRAAITPQADYNRYFLFDLQQTGSSPRHVAIQATGAYAGGSTFNLDVPDLSSVSGFDPNWGLKVGTSTTWTFSATGWTGVGLVTAAFVDGASYFVASQQGSITP